MKYQQFYEKGYQIFENILKPEEILNYKQIAFNILKKQENEFGIDKLKLINEKDMIRSPFLYNEKFKDLFYNQFAMKVVEDILGEYAILSLQNGIVVSPNQNHHQSFFHRDIIHQEFISSTPLAINLYYCLDDYNEKNGGTTFIPHSHKKEKLNLSDKCETPEVKAGSVILFDSMVFHKAGTNNTDRFRCGINNMYTLPFIKQQINYTICLKKKTNDSKFNRLMGFESREFLNVKDFRNYRLKRIQK